jgi:hypothetical protein
VGSLASWALAFDGDVDYRSDDPEAQSKEERDAATTDLLETKVNMMNLAIMKHLKCLHKVGKKPDDDDLHLVIGIDKASKCPLLVQ